ncbi:MAG: cytochrome c3 family protein [Desulfobulbaceae bacterium]|nr:cytochrome c3 family protein [Desulfobulbaceae bacterium]
MYGLTAHAGDYRNSSHGNNVSRARTADKGYATGNCAHCHEQHASIERSTATPNPALTFATEEALCSTCHQTIQTAINKPYSHPIDNLIYEDLHTIGKMEAGQNGAPFSGNNRHVECADCHEPHTAQADSHVHEPGTIHGNEVSGVLKGTWGVEPSSYPVSWAPPTNFTELKPATKEYQICFKCHSYYALQDSDGITGITPGPSGATVTDQSMEFNPNNASFHPVVQALGSNALSDPERIAAPWQNIGDQTMYCSDCHGDDTGYATAGPHGSNNRYMLKGEGASAVSWPTKADGVTLWRLSDATSSEASQIYCNLCHELDASGGTWRTWGSWGSNGVHAESRHAGYYCVNCHVAVPHGWKRKRFIAFSGDDPPYNYNGNYAKITRYTWKADARYSSSDCSATCSGRHY